MTKDCWTGTEVRFADRFAVSAIAEQPKVASRRRFLARALELTCATVAGAACARPFRHVNAAEMAERCALQS